MKTRHHYVEPLETGIAPANAMFFHAFADDLKVRLDTIQGRASLVARSQGSPDSSGLPWA